MSTDSEELKNCLRRFIRRDWSIDGYLEEYCQEPEIEIHPMGSEDWLRFARSGLIESINGSPVNTDTGLSNREMLDYFMSAYIPNSEFDDFG